MLCSGKHGTFSPVLLLDASTTLANKSVENLLHIVVLGWCVLGDEGSAQVYQQQAVLVLEHTLIHESHCWLNNIDYGKKTAGHVLFCPLPLHRGMRCKGRTQGCLPVCSLSYAFSYCSYLYSLFPCVLSHMWLSFFPVKPFAIKELMTRCIFCRRKKERLWLMVSPHCCLYFLLIVLAEFLFLNSGTAVTVSECFILPYWQMSVKVV